MRFPANPGSSTTSCSPCAATTFMPGTPAIGADTTPSGRTMRISPRLSVTRKLPSGRNANDQGLVSLVVMVSTTSFGDAFDGAGAFVCPGNAGCGCGCVEGENAFCAYRDNPTRTSASAFIRWCLLDGRA